jgi:hypothetical protein
MSVHNCKKTGGGGDGGTGKGGGDGKSTVTAGMKKAG